MTSKNALRLKYVLNHKGRPQRQHRLNPKKSRKIHVVGIVINEIKLPINKIATMSSLRAKLLGGHVTQILVK